MAASLPCLVLLLVLAVCGADETEPLQSGRGVTDYDVAVFYRMLTQGRNCREKKKQIQRILYLLSHYIWIRLT